jgi:hypothetical protein
MPRNGQPPPRGYVPYKDPEKRGEFHRKWRAANRDKIRKASQKWRTAHLDQVRQKNRAWREANREKVRAQQRKYQAAKRAKAKNTPIPAHAAEVPGTTSNGDTYGAITPARLKSNAVAGHGPAGH